MSTETQHNGMKSDEQTVALDADGKVRVPVVELLTGRGFITGKSGSGKSNSASVVAEELLDGGFPLLIVDVEGEYYGLKEEYEMLHVGADEDCELQVGPEHADKLADLALVDNVPIILDVSGFLDEDEASELIRETARSLFTKQKKQKKPFLLLIEECHEWIPEGGGLDDTGKMLVKIAKRGRKHGLGILGMSQRPANVKKDFITQCDWLLWHRLTWDNDTKVVRRVVNKETADAVEGLEDGEGFLMADWDDMDIRKVQVRRKHTFDAGATPGLDDFERPELKSVSGDLVDELEEISQQQSRRQDRIAQLEAQVEELRDEKSELEEELDSAQDMRDMASQFAEAMQASGGNGDVASEKVDELIEERNTLQNRLEEREQRVEELQSELDETREELRQRPDIDERAVEAVEVLAEEFEVGGEDSQRLREKLKSARERIDELESQENEPSLETDVLENTKVQRLIGEMKRRIGALGEKERDMLRYYMIDGPCGMEDAYKYAGGSPTSGAKSDNTRTLRDAGLVAKEGKGEYGYGLRKHVGETLGDGFSDDEVEAVFKELDEAVTAAVMADE